MNMNSDKSQSEAIETRRSIKDTGLQFLFGVIAGSLLVVVPLSYFQFFTVSLPLSVVQIVGAIGIVLLCGVVSMIWGKQAIATMMKLVELSPWQ